MPDAPDQRLLEALLNSWDTFRTRFGFGDETFRGQDETFRGQATKLPNLLRQSPIVTWPAGPHAEKCCALDSRGKRA